MKAFCRNIFFLLSPLTLLSQNKLDSIQLLHEVSIQSFKQKSSLQQLPYSIQIVSKKILQQANARSLPESMMHLPGVMIQKSTHGGGSPFVRGLTGNQALIVIDGIRLNNAIFRYGPNQYLNLMEPDWINSVEILKGSGAVQYGSDALSGVIHLETNQLTFNETAKWYANLNSRYTYKSMEKTIRPSLGYQNKNISIQASLAFKEFNNLIAGGNIGKQIPTGYNENNQHLNAIIQLQKKWILKINYQKLFQSNVPVFYKYHYENFKINTSSPIKRSMAYIIINKKFENKMFDELKFFVSSQRITETRSLQKNGSTILRIEKDAAKTVGIGGELKNTWFNKWRASTGFDLYLDLINSSRIDQSTIDGSSKALRGLYPNNARYQSFSFYHLHHLKWGKLQLEAGTRYNIFLAKINDPTLGYVTLQPKASIFQTGASYQLFKNLFLYANFSEGFRAPNIDDLGSLGIIDFRYEKPNYDLQPEKSFNSETGLKFFNKAAQADIAIFRSNLRNLISRIKTNQIINDYEVYVKENVEKAYIKGIEVCTNILLTKKIIVKGNMTYLYGQSITRNEPLRRIPPLTTNLIVSYQFSAHEAGMIYFHADPQYRLAQGDKDDVRIGENGTARFNVVSMFSTFKFKKISTQLYLNNLTNAVYKTHGSGLYEMGRSFTISFNFLL